MDTEKRFSCLQAPIKSYNCSVTIQLPTTSANNHHNHYHHHHLHHNHQSGHTNASNSDQLTSLCQHQAATRILLLEENGRLASASHQAEPSEQSSTPPPHYHEIPGVVPAYHGRTSGPPPSYDEVVNPNAPPPSYHSLFGQVREARKTSNGLVDLLRQLFLILIGTLGCTMVIGFLLLIPITMILVGIIYVNECRAENIPYFLVIGGIVWIIKNILNCYNQFKKDSTTANRPPPRRTPVSASSRDRINQTSSVLIVNQQPRTNAILPTTQSHSSSTRSSHSSSESGSATRFRDGSSRAQRSSSQIRHPSLIGITSFKCESMLNYFLVVWFLAGCIVVYRIYEPDYENPLSSSYCNRTVYLYAFWLMTSTFIIMAVVLSCLCCLMASSLMSCNHG